MTETDKTQRGFSKYGSGACSYGIKWRFQESSAVGHLKVWMFIEGVTPGGGRTQNAALHLSVEQLSRIRDQIDDILKYEESDENAWRRDLEYLAAWSDD